MTNKMDISYDGKKLSDYFFVTDALNREIIAGVTNTTIKVGHTNGETFSDTTRNMKKISMPFYMNENNPKSLEAIAEILDVREPKRLIFGDEPDWYYMAIPDGDISFTQLEKEGNGTINWIVPDGLKHSLKTKTFKNDGKNEIEFDNLGNVDTPVKMKVTMKSDNGFLGIVLNGNYYQIGKPAEVNGHQLPPDIEIVKDGVAEFPKGVINKKGFSPLPTFMGGLSQTGTIETNNQGIEVTGYGQSTEKSWAGPSITWQFPAIEDGTIGAKHFFLWADAWFETLEYPEAGFQVHTIQNKDGKRLFSVLYLDQSGDNRQSKVVAFVNDKKVYEAENNWTGYGYRGFMSMTKAGNNFVLVYGNTTKTFVDTSLENEEGYYYTIGYGQWFNNPSVHKDIVVNWKLWHKGIDSWLDTPNFFKAGDVVTIDSATNTVEINGATNWDYTDVGSSPLRAVEGHNILGIAKSDYATMPDVELSFSERKL